MIQIVVILSETKDLASECKISIIRNFSFESQMLHPQEIQHDNTESVSLNKCFFQKLSCDNINFAEFYASHAKNIITDFPDFTRPAFKYNYFKTIMLIQMHMQR